MVLLPKYNLEDIKEELLKTRLLCNFCHRLHTAYQNKNGVFDNIKHFI